ncbi:MAG: metallophosphoesterase family protein [Solirubrobacteraceae bacterium]
MSTLILSDLHLGSLTRTDLLRRPELRAALLEELRDVERVVLLGDVLELRHGPLREALTASQPFFEDLGRVLAGKELVISAGNHDHALVEPWLESFGRLEGRPPLKLEQLIEPAEASPAMATIAEWAAPARVRVAYPGLWVRRDVYAMHGHYLDCHLTIPTLERLSVGVMSRVLGRPAESFDSVEDYEAMGAPVFAWRDAVARYTRTSSALNGMATVSAWQALGGGRPARDGDGAARDGDGGARDGDGAARDGDGGARDGDGAARDGRAARDGGGGGAARDRAAGPGAHAPLARLLQRARTRAFVLAFPLAVAGLNRAGIGPLRADISSTELRRAGLEAMGEVGAHLGLGDCYVVFGHTHRPGPLPGDDPQEWLGRAGARLVNAGSWTYAGIFLRGEAEQSPYWPGACVLVGEDGPPEVRKLLQDRSREELRPPRPAAHTS